MTVYIKKSETMTKKLLELINSYSKFAGYSVSIQKSVTSLYINNEQVEYEIKNTIPFTLAPQKMKYLGIQLSKYVQDL